MATGSTLPPEHLELLYRAGLEFNATLDPDELLPRVFHRAVELLEAEAGSIWIRDGDALRCAMATGPVGTSVEGVELPVGAGMVGEVAAEGEAQLVTDAREHPRFVHQVDEATGFETRSAVVAPITAKGEVLGVLQVLNKRTGEGRFDEADAALLEGLGATAGLALRNAQLHEAERRARDLRTLLGISREITATLDTDRLAVTVVNLASQAIDYDRAALALFDGGTLRLRAVSGEETLDAESEENRELRRLMTWLTERGEAAYVADLEGDSELSASLREVFGDYLAGRDVRALQLLPLEDEQGRLGALYLESTTPGFLGEGGREAAALLANQTTVALRNAQLHGQVPFIGLLEPVAAWRGRLREMSRRQLLTRVVAPAALALIVLLIPWGERVGTEGAILLPGDRTPVRATVPGVVDEVRVREGDRVERGAVLGRLRQDELTVRIQETEAHLARARRALASARASGAELSARLAQIEEERWSSVLELLREQERRTRLRAPAPGVVLTSRPHEMVGRELAAGETFVLVGRTDVLELEARVPHDEISRVQKGHGVRFRVPALPGNTYVAHVTEVASHADVASENPGPSFVVRALLTNEGGRLRPGMEARAKIVGRRLPVGYHLLHPLVDWVRMHLWR